jgi:hypothetical protein
MAGGGRRATHRMRAALVARRRADLPVDKSITPERSRTCVARPFDGGGYLTGSSGVLGVGPSEDTRHRAVRSISSANRCVPGRRMDGCSLVADPANQENPPGRIRRRWHVHGGVHLNITGQNGHIGLREAPPVSSPTGHRHERLCVSGQGHLRPSGYSLYAGGALRCGPSGAVRQLKSPRTQPSPDGSRVLPLEADDSEWTSHPWFIVALAWTL